MSKIAGLDRAQILEMAVQAAREGDSPTFQLAIRAVHAAGWAGLEAGLARRFIEGIQQKLGTLPPVGDLALLSKAVFPLSSRVLATSPYDLEFLMRAAFGASLLAKTIPLEISLVMQIAVIGVLPEVPEVQPGSPCWDGVLSEQE